MIHLERNGPLNDLHQEVTTARQGAASLGSSSTSGVQTSASEEALLQICATFAEQMKQQQALIQQLISATGKLTRIVRRCFDSKTGTVKSNLTYF
jgi:hypothetical protein